MNPTPRNLVFPGLERSPDWVVVGPMETCLTDELLRRIFAYVPPSALLHNVRFTSTRWAAIIRQDTFWRYEVTSSEDLLAQPPCQRDETWPNQGYHLAENQVTFRPSTHQLQRYALYREAICLQQQQQQRPGNDNHNPSQQLYVLQHGSVLTPQKQARHVQSHHRTTCLASTTDRAREVITNVLPVPDILHLYGMRTGIRWWSSRPTATPDARTETLLVATHAPVSLLTRVDIKPLLDPYVGHVVYSWKHTKISAYWLPHNTNKLVHDYPCSFALRPDQYATGQDQQDVIDGILKDATPVFTQTWAVEHAHRPNLLSYDLPSGGVVANVLAIELIGKHVEQMPNSGYYACVERLDCQGIPLYHRPDEAHRAPSSTWASSFGRFVG